MNPQVEKIALDPLTWQHHQVPTGGRTTRFLDLSAATMAHIHPMQSFNRYGLKTFFLTSDLLGSCGYGAGSDDFPLFLERRFLWNALWSFVG